MKGRQAAAKPAEADQVDAVSIALQTAASGRSAPPGGPSLPAVCLEFIATLRAGRNTKPGSSRRAGRPSRLTPAVCERLFLAICTGVPWSVAAGYAGISKATFYSWLERGRDGNGGEFIRFLDACDAAGDVAQMTLIALMRRAANSDYRAAARLLELRWPKKYGRRDRVTLPSIPIVFEMDTGGNPALRRKRGADSSGDE